MSKFTTTEAVGVLFFCFFLFLLYFKETQNKKAKPNKLCFPVFLLENEVGDIKSL